jgi:hypothetical protein
VSALEKHGKGKLVIFVPRYLVAIFYRDYEALGDLRKHKIEIVQQTARKLEEDAGYRVNALLNSEQISALETEGFRIEIIQNVDEVGRARQEQVGKGNRYLQR